MLSDAPDDSTVPRYDRDTYQIGSLPELYEPNSVTPHVVDLVLEQFASR